jgi:1-acyl-sn-glycerol-3-phosphate acyltransferase
VKGPLTFLVKRELANNLVTRSILGRLGSIFVERYDPSRATEGAHQAADAAREGACLVFFPEGTTTRRPGLASFHLGAFIVAAQAQVPVLPLAIRGSRSILRSDVWFPRPGVIDVDVGELLEPDGEDIQAARRLRERGRAFILEHSGDPDLAGEENPLVTRLHRQREALEAR